MIQCDEAYEGPDTQCNVSCNLQRNSTLGRCKIDKYMIPSQMACASQFYRSIGAVVLKVHLI